MIIGTLEVELGIPGANSLKDRRQVVKSMVEHLRNRFNASVAEVDDPGVWRRANIGIAVVANESRFVNEMLSKILDAVDADPRVSIIDSEMEIL